MTNMKYVAVAVNGGVVHIEENKGNVNVKIVDFDNGDPEIKKEEVNKFDAIIFVRGGVAEVAYNANDVSVTIKDYDNV